MSFSFDSPQYSQGVVAYSELKKDISDAYLPFSNTHARHATTGWLLCTSTDPRVLVLIIPVYVNIRVGGSDILLIPETVCLHHFVSKCSYKKSYLLFIVENKLIFSLAVGVSMHPFQGPERRR